MSVSPVFPCPHCGARSFQRHPVAVEPASADALAHLATCGSCGENYLATVHADPDGTRVETWDYYLERTPSLRRVRTYRPRGRFREFKEGDPQFFVNGVHASEAAWRSELATHRAARSPLVEPAPREYAPLVLVSRPDRAEAPAPAPIPVAMLAGLRQAGASPAPGEGTLGPHASSR